MTWHNLPCPPTLPAMSTACPHGWEEIQIEVTPGKPTADPPLNEVQTLIVAECDAVKDMLLEKNKAYGNSALDPIRCFSKAPIDEQIRVRMDDKLSRLARGQAAGEDVERDLLGYLILLRVSRRLGGG